jgi:hypothetical protein
MGLKCVAADAVVARYATMFRRLMAATRPKHYCLSDPIFYQESPRIGIDKVQKLYAVMQGGIDWPMNIYTYREHYSKFVKFSGLTNKNINVIGVNSMQFSEKRHQFLQNFFYAKGLSIPCHSSVIITAILVSINSGYSAIKLYGADHNFFDRLHVNENNELCVETQHFYEKDMILIPMLHAYSNRPMKVSEYIMYMAKIFAGHESLAKYAESLNVNILNCTKNSLIDAYKRVPLRTYDSLIGNGNENT